MDYLKEDHRHAKERFQLIQDSLAKFCDNNRNFVTASTQTQEQLLQLKYDLAYDLYNGLSQQLERAKMRLQEETPLFKELDPVQVPVEKSSYQPIFNCVFKYLVTL